MAVNRGEVSARAEEEKQRVQEQSQLVYLQTQIDELRRMIKDQNNKYAWAIEQSRRSEGQVVQLQNLLERQAQEIQTTLEVYKREITALRREVAGAMLRVEEPIKPIREMQAQIHQLQEVRRQDREANAPWQGRVEEIEHKAKETLALVRESDDRFRQLQGQLDQFRVADSAALEHIRRLDEQIQIEKQNLRRQAVEAQQLVADVRGALDDPVARIGRLEERVRLNEEDLEAIPQHLDALAGRIPALQEEIRRVELVSTERFLMNQERLEDLRHQNDERMGELNESGEEHLLHITSWLERIDTWCREEEGRVARMGNRLELLQQRHETRISDLEAQELELMERIAGAWTGVLEVVKAGQVERRDGDTERSNGHFEGERRR
jgi:chromosome segregation ATPase